MSSPNDMEFANGSKAHDVSATEKTRENNATRKARGIEKARQVLELRKSGASFPQIARAVGYRDAGGAYKAYRKALEATLREPADEVREMAVARLDEALLRIWPQVQQGKLLAVDRFLRIEERRALLLGLDAPTRRIVDVVTHDTLREAIAQTRDEIARMEQASMQHGQGLLKQLPPGRAIDEAEQELQTKRLFPKDLVDGQEA